MIVIDTSALIAILRDEAEAAAFTRLITESDRCFLSAISYFECAMVLIGHRRAEAAEPLDALIALVNVDIVPYDLSQARESRSAFARFGKGRHPAGLNFGDCVSYALAQSRGLPLLFKGQDFAKTDIVSALP